MEKLASESYSGSREQNLKLLVSLVPDDHDAITAAEKAETLLRENRTKVSPIELYAASPSWVPGKCFGINGSYALTESASISRNPGKLPRQQQPKNHNDPGAHTV